MHDFTELDRNIDLNKPEKYHLSIQLGQDGFSFCILEKYIKRYVGIRHYQINDKLYFNDYLEKIRSIINEDNLLKLPYASVSLLFPTRKSILIPGDIFEKEEIKAYFDLNDDLDDLDEIHFNFIPLFNTYNVFAIHTDLLNIFRSNFKSLKLYHQWSSVLCSLELENSKQGSCTLINFNSNFFDLIVVNEMKLIFCNSFEIKNENDFAFYLLNSLKNLDPEIKKSKILMIGNTSNKSKYFDLLNMYIKNFEIGDLTEEFSYSPALKNTVKPTFYNLYNIFRCELLEENTGV